MYYSDGRKLYPHDHGLFSYVGPARAETYNVTFEVYTSLREFGFPFFFQMPSDCIPDYDKRFFNFTNTTMILEATTDEMFSIAWTALFDYYSQNIFTIDTLKINFLNAALPIVYVQGHYTAELYLNNVDIVNSSMTNPFIIGLIFDKLVLNNVNIESTTVSSLTLIEGDYLNEFGLTNFTFYDSTASSSLYNSIVYVYANPYATVSISSWNVLDSNIGQYDMFYVNTLSTGSLFVDEVIFQNVSINTGANIIKTGTINTFYIFDSIFSQIVREDINDDTSSIINIGSIELIELGQYSMQNITSDS